MQIDQQFTAALTLLEGTEAQGSWMDYWRRGVWRRRMNRRGRQMDAPIDTARPAPTSLGLCAACLYFDPIDQTIGFCRVGPPVFAGPQISQGVERAQRPARPVRCVADMPTLDWCGKFLKK